MRPWNPDKYLVYANLHSQAIWDLVHRIRTESPRTIVDLGCGPGNSTEFIAERWPDAEITGVDISKEMLEKGVTKHPQWHWVLAGIEDLVRPSRLTLCCRARHCSGFTITNGCCRSCGSLCKTVVRWRSRCLRIENRRFTAQYFRQPETKRGNHLPVSRGRC